jgi:hypothetical protein
MQHPGRLASPDPGLHRLRQQDAELLQVQPGARQHAPLQAEQPHRRTLAELRREAWLLEEAGPHRDLHGAIEAAGRAAQRPAVGEQDLPRDAALQRFAHVHSAAFHGEGAEPGPVGQIDLRRRGETV